jgi:hypothetical protein
MENFPWRKISCSIAQPIFGPIKEFPSLDSIAFSKFHREFSILRLVFARSF